MLTIEVISYKERPLPRPQARDFDEMGGTIGRRENSTLWLEDPERMNDGSAISRDHARIEYQAGHYVIIDNGANPLRINNRTLGKGKEARLADGDQLSIGDYVLQVRMRQTGIAPPGKGAPRIEPTLGPVTSREAGIDTLVSRDALEKIARPANADRPLVDRQRVVTSSMTEDANPHPRSRELQKLEEQLGIGVPPLEPEPSYQSFSAERDTNAPAQHLSQVDRNAAPTAGGIVVSWGKENEPDLPRVRDIPVKTTPHVEVREQTSMKGEAEGTTAPTEHDPLAVTSKLKAVAPSDSPQVPDGLLEAFLAGAGNPNLKLPQGLDAETLFQLGELMRATVGGILQLLKVRSETKSEVGAKLTIIAPYVNPLKFSPDVNFALQQLMASQSKGFMPPIRAIHDAFSDLISHQVGLLAGLDAAMNALIDRFSPEQLQRQLVDKGLLDSVIPFKEKAKLWDLFETKFDDIKEKAREGVDNAFRTEFVKAYEGKVAELRRARVPDSARKD